MAKLILSLDNSYLSEYPLTKARTSIGRRSSNDIHLDNLAVSGEHAVIVKMGNGYYVEDLESTNGTLVNDEATKKHLLQHADVIALGKYQLQYLNDAASGNANMESAPAFEKTMMIHPSAMRSAKSRPVEESVSRGQSMKSSDEPSGDRVIAPNITSATVPVAPSPSVVSETVGRIQVLNGSSSGRELVLNKALTTLGKTGVQVAVITKRPNGYFITHVEGQVLPIVNGVSTGAQAFSLNDHDVIELAGVKMEFYLTKS